MASQSTFVAILLLIFGTAVADENDGWFKLGESLGGGTQTDRDAAYLEGRRLGEEIRERQARKALIEAEASYQQHMSRIRLGLKRNWEHFGFATEDAHAIAYAYRESEEEEAVFRRVRNRTDEQIAGDIRGALEDYNFLLANQLLLGLALKRQDTRGASQE